MIKSHSLCETPTSQSVLTHPILPKMYVSDMLQATLTKKTNDMTMKAHSLDDFHTPVYSVNKYGRYVVLPHAA